MGGTATNLAGLVGGQSGTAREREDLVGLVVAGGQPVTWRLQTTTLKLQGACKVNRIMKTIFTGIAYVGTCVSRGIGDVGVRSARSCALSQPPLCG